MMRKTHMAILILSASLISANHMRVFEDACLSVADKSFYGFGFCFVISGYTGPWENYPNVCTHFPNGHLAVVSNTAIKDYLSAKLVENGVLDPYIGGRQANKTAEPNGNWEWVISGDRKINIDLNSGFWTGPDNGGNNEECAHFHPSVRLFNDWNCNNNQKYLCQYHNNQAVFDRMFIDTRGHPDSVFWENTGVKAGECAERCSDTAFCFMFDIRRDIGHCLLHWDDASFAHLTTTNQNGYEIYMRVQ